MKTRSLIRVLTRSGAILLVLGKVAVVAQAAPHAKIGSSRASAIVLKRFPGHLTTATVLENEEGHWQYGVMVRSGKTLREVMVDAYTGKIASVEVTSDAKERVEKQQDAVAAKAHKSKKNEKGEADGKDGDEKGAGEK